MCGVLPHGFEEAAPSFHARATGAQPEAWTAIILGRLPVDPAELLHFFKCLPHADEADSAAGGIEDGVGISPAELLDELVAHGLFAFDAEGLFEGGDVEPAFAFCAFGDDAAAVRDEAVDESDMRAVGDAFDIVGDGDVAEA